MSITDELRAYAGNFYLFRYKDVREKLDAIANRIDAEHESACAEAYGNGVESVALPDMTAYVKLPVDSDGVPIRVGDVMDSRVDYLFDGKPFTVRALVLCEDGWEVADGRFGNRYELDSLRHHHEPTVEDVLREMLDAWGELPSNATNEAIIAEYAAKLRLAGDAE